ncbi:class I SAM-dependent methyltransferase [Deinococcus maricopensis]|uniref:N-methyl-transferase-related protein n=1 Tax=Deinococcus maricopensis (strain DSM 21211 / LMG 22137 / NRRL B-23946 / LB-34) TaxID=709986 RepID=E8U8P0_DEIML|nr:class I SAM-dependent methyltransferase [Deinococcus maricopensis]ADV67429.1 N-methyl-transferase-related protein [Deinococcus maricopensis DSM 21211]
MDWVHSFYDTQDELTGCHSSGLHPHHHALAARLTAHRGQPGSLLELGAGGGQFAVAAAQVGHAVTALELRPSGTVHTQRLAALHGVQVNAMTGDFYTADPGGPFDMLAYWDGFGVGDDAEQARLLARFPEWLAPGGAAYVDVYTPWYWAQHAGFTRETPAYVQSYGFDADRCRLLDTYARADGKTVTQSLRCYSPEDVRRLLHGTALVLDEVWPGGRFDPRAGTWHPRAPLGECLSFTAVLKRA